MIRITCTQCRGILEMDDAFAGGVCRCQHCGTIQTVPMNAAAQPAAPPPAGVVPKSFHPPRPRATAASASPGTTLDELADIVASSGLSSGRLRVRAGADSAIAAPVMAPPGSQRRVILLAAIAGLAALIAVLLFVWMWKQRSGGGAPTKPPQNTSSVATNGPAESDGAALGTSELPSGPAFYSRKLDAASIVYVIDSGQAMSNYFAAIQGLTERSIASLGATRQFAVIMPGALRFPATGIERADSKAVSDAKQAIDQQWAHGGASLRTSIADAIAEHPALIVLVTAQSDNELDTDLADYASGQMNGHAIPVDTIFIGTDPCKTLQRIAADSGGKYISIRPEILNHGALE